MNLQLLEQAKKRVPCIPVLVNMVSKRVRQINAGFRPYVRPESPDEDRLDTVLREIAMGKLTTEIDFAPPPAAEEEAAI